jgi:hypothetical protein
MLDTLGAQIEKLIIHRVGNKVRDEKFTKSEVLALVPADANQIVLTYFLSPFVGKDETFHFTHPTEITLNEIFTYATRIFAENESFVRESGNILNHLYEQSTHPKITEGDLFVAYFSGIKYNQRKIDVIGIFKAEKKEPFIKTTLKKGGIQLIAESGINAKGLEKGCLILNIDKKEGFIVLNIDTSGYDTQYWMDNFLKVTNVQSNNYHTKTYLQLCKDFGSQYIQPNFDKKENIIFLNKSFEYFKNSEVFDFNEFTETVIPEKSVAKEFKRFQSNYQKEYGIDELNDFEISKVAVKSMKRRFKNFIALDTNIELRLNFKDPETDSRFVERGYDNQKKMHYYKVYFNKEIN